MISTSSDNIPYLDNEDLFEVTSVNGYLPKIDGMAELP